MFERRVASLIFAVVLIASTVSLPELGRSQNIHLTGTVHERGSTEVIPGASLAIIGTSRGAKANREGRFDLKLDAGASYRIRVTSIGFRPDTLRFMLTKDSTTEIALSPAPVGGAMITVSADASRREAHRIIQKVIDSKDAWQSAIKDYKFQVYARLNVRTQKDTSSKVIAILESVADGYWKKDKGYAERITARKQTANLPAEANRAALFDVDNFYNERIDFDEYSVISPVAHDAFDRYDYDLIGEGELNGTSVYKISVEPRSALYPSFQGILWIDKTDYTIAYLRLSSNEAIKIGPVKDISVSQTFSLVDNKYWMPSQLDFGFSIKVDFPFIPVFHMEQSAVLQDYVINGGVQDSLFGERRHSVAPTADSVDSVHWVAMRMMPLATDEAAAYHSFDSLGKIPIPPPSFSPLGLLFQIVPIPDVYSFNRVEGSRFTLASSFKPSDAWPLTIGGSVGYGVGDNRWKYSISATQGLTWTKNRRMSASMSLSGDVDFGGMKTTTSVTSSIGGRVYDTYIMRGQEYDRSVNTLTALFLHNDYPDYYRAKGFTIDYSLDPNSKFSSGLHFKNEDQTSLKNVTNYSLLLASDTFRTNSAINDGRLHEIGAFATESFSSGNWQGSGSLQFAYSSAGIGSQFDYLTGAIEASLEGKTGGWGRTWLHGKFDYTLNGSLPNQSLFHFESRNVVLAPRETFRTMSPLEFRGDRASSLMFEQNFYDLPTRALGIKLPIDLHWFGFANAATMDITAKSQNALATPVEPIGLTPYLEAGFGIGNILNIFRFDATWRLTHKVDRNFFVTGTLAFSF